MDTPKQPSFPAMKEKLCKLAIAFLCLKVDIIYSRVILTILGSKVNNKLDCAKATNISFKGSFEKKPSKQDEKLKLFHKASKDCFAKVCLLRISLLLGS